MVTCLDYVSEMTYFGSFLPPQTLPRHSQMMMMVRERIGNIWDLKMARTDALLRASDVS